MGPFSKLHALPRRKDGGLPDENRQELSVVLTAIHQLSMPGKDATAVPPKNPTSSAPPGLSTGLNSRNGN
jgi:hypothetical protein